MSQSDPGDAVLLILIIVLGSSFLILGGIGSMFGHCEALLERAWNGLYVLSQSLFGGGALGMITVGYLKARITQWSRWDSTLNSLFILSALCCGGGIVLLAFLWGETDVPGCSRGVIEYLFDSIRAGIRSLADGIRGMTDSISALKVLIYFCLFK